MSARKRAALALLLFVGLLCAYLGNGFSVQNVTADSTGNLLVPVVLLETGKLRFTPTDAPALFRFQQDGPPGQAPVSVNLRTLGDPADPRSAAARLARGELRLAGHKYSVVPSRIPGVYVNTFGVGAGLVALPVFAAARALYGDLRQRPALWFRCGKIAGALTTAASAVVLLLLALSWCRPQEALLAALCYGLATCAFAIDSQTLWQHGPAALLLSLHAAALLSPRRSMMIAAGLCAGLAVACRPTCALVVLAVGGHLLLALRAPDDRPQALRRLLRYAAGGLPVALLLGVYQQHYLGSPLASGQVLSSRASGLAERGTAALFTTPPWEGAAGLLLSPGRGLFFYSPVLLFALWGAFRCLRPSPTGPRPAVAVVLRPLLLGALLQALVAFCWYDWWGGVCYGYRPLVDTLPALGLALAVALAALQQEAPGPRRLVLRGGFALLALWSLLAQVAGAYAAEPLRWNFRPALSVLLPGERAPRVVSSPEELQRLQGLGGRPVGKTTAAVYDESERYRLWSLADNPVFDNILQLAERLSAPAR